MKNKTINFKAIKALQDEGENLDTPLAKFVMKYGEKLEIDEWVCVFLDDDIFIIYHADIVFVIGYSDIDNTNKELNEFLRNYRRAIERDELKVTILKNPLAFSFRG